MELRISIFFIFFSLLTSVHASSPISAVFAFGDSTVDSGNNNGLDTLFRSDHPPYGRDFPGYIPSGRFCNGKLATDYIVSSLGLKEFLPAYLDQRLNDSELLTGVSFASAGSGLDELTVVLSKVLSMSTQLEYFDEALKRIERTVGAVEASRVVENALFFISVGTNDMLYNFYDLPTRAFEYSLLGYHDFLLRKLESVIQRLYSAGARRFLVVGFPPIGCLPLQVTGGSIVPGEHMLQRVCIDQQNSDSQAYNIKIQALTSELQATLHGARVAYLDIYNPIMDMIMNPAKYGFEQTVLKGCCGTGLVEMGALCGEFSPTCMDASKHLFWDAVHLTQAAYSVLANIFEQNALPCLVG